MAVGLEPSQSNFCVFTDFGFIGFVKAAWVSKGGIWAIGFNSNEQLLDGFGTERPKTRLGMPLLEKTVVERIDVDAPFHKSLDEVEPSRIAQ